MAFLKGVGTFILMIAVFAVGLFLLIAAAAITPVLMIFIIAFVVAYAVYDDHKKKKGKGQ